MTSEDPPKEEKPKARPKISRAADGTDDVMKAMMLASEQEGEGSTND